MVSQQNNSYSMTYLSYGQLLSSNNMSSIQMIKQAGTVVSLSTKTIANAMRDFDNSTSYIVALSNAPGLFLLPLFFFPFKK